MHSSRSIFLDLVTFRRIVITMDLYITKSQGYSLVMKMAANLVHDGLRDAAGMQENYFFIFDASLDARFRIRNAKTSEGVELEVAVLREEVVDPSRLRARVRVGNVGGLVQLLAAGDAALKPALLHQLLGQVHEHSALRIRKNVNLLKLSEKG